jgi:hypothetical protein
MVFLNGKAQFDSSKYYILTVKPELGVFFPANKFLQDFYKSKAFSSWGLGTEIGKSTSGISLLVNFSHTGSRVDSVSYDTTSHTNSARSYSVTKNQFSIGIVNYMKISNNSFLLFKSIFSTYFVKEDLHDVSENPYGMAFSVGLSNRISKRISTFIDLGYDFVNIPAYNDSGTNHNKPNYFQPKDWSGFYLKTGLNINLLRNR